MPTTKIIISKLDEILSAWENLAPEESFGGYTLEQFKEEVKPSFAAREELERLATETSDAIARRASADASSNRAMRFVINSVRGHRKFGEDSPLYATMGYVRRSDRRSGLTRKSKLLAVPVQKAA